MSEFWAHVPELAGEGVITLSAEEARHVATRRLRAGDAFVVFDGRGRRAPARLESVARREVIARVGPVEEVVREDPEFVLASAIPKGDRLSTMLQMLTQLGVGTWQPLVLDDSAMRRLDPASTRLQRILVESAKVSRRAWLMDVRRPIGLEPLLASSPGPVAFGDREGQAGPLDPATALLVVGPEAGLSETERRRLREAGARAYSFSPHNLRIETAAIAAAVARQLARGEQGGGKDG